MTFFDSSTPVPIQQDSPSVKAPDEMPPVGILPTTTVNPFTPSDRDPLFFMGGEYPFSFDKDEPISIDEWTVKNIRDFSKGTGLSQDQIIAFLQFISDTGHAIETRRYIIVKPTWELLDQFVAQEADAGQYPVMDFPALPLEDGVKAQLDRMEAFLLEIKGAVTVDTPMTDFYMPEFIPPVLDDFDHALEDAKAQQEAAESAPELLTEEEINRIYQSVSRDVERKEYDRIINRVIALNNYAKGVR